MKLQIVPSDLLDLFKRQIAVPVLTDAFHQLKDAEISSDGFSFYTSVASVYSSKIEGETIELDSYIKHKRFGVEFQPDYTRKIDDLYLAYQFARETTLDRETLAKAHTLLTQHILPVSSQGKFRSKNMYVTTMDGRSARLLEKWFLAEKLGEKAWFVQSEKFYYDHHQLYYDNIRALGLEYDSLDYGQALKFLLMLPGTLMEEGSVM